MTPLKLVKRIKDPCVLMEYKAYDESNRKLGQTRWRPLINCALSIMRCQFLLASALPKLAPYEEFPATTLMNSWAIYVSAHCQPNLEVLPFGSVVTDLKPK